MNVDPDLPADLLENWCDLRLRLIWAYDGPLTEYRQYYYFDYALAAWLIRRGEVRLTFPTHTETYTAGNWVFPRLQEGWQEFSEDAEILSIRFVAEWPTGQTLFDHSRTMSVPAAGVPRLTRVGERLARYVDREFPGARTDLARRGGSLERHLKIHRFLHSWLLAYVDLMEREGQIAFTISQLDDRVRRAVQSLERRSLGTPLRESELAVQAGISVHHLTRLFVRDLGKTPAEYWEAKRVLAARQALLDSSQSIKSLAYELGFSSLPHFSTWVKKRLGRSPRAVRAMHRPDA
jgi:AraC-like DNA-binding protein